MLADVHQDKEVELHMRFFRQLGFPFRSRGGRRKGAGRKPKGERAGVPHVAREKLSGHEPLHITLKLAEGLPSLRNQAVRDVLRGALCAARERFLRVNHFSFQADHIHLIVEADDKESLSRGMLGLQVRFARALNKLWKRTGKVFRDRYHAHVLRTLREVRNALLYVMNNFRKHALNSGIADFYASGAYFDGWREEVVGAQEPEEEWPVVRARTWMQCIGWREVYELISLYDVPGSKRKGRRKGR